MPFADLLAFVKKLWKYADWGWTEEDTKYHIFDRGLERERKLDRRNVIDSYIFWGMCWQESRRGGPYLRHRGEIG
jgi:hypothetical protein